MNVRITPGVVQGSLLIPPSKSHTQRILAASLLHNGITLITGYGVSDDEKAALNIIKQLDVTVEKNHKDLTITSSGIAHQEGVINCGESGLAARLFTPIAALSDQEIIITGEGSLLKRPMSFFKEYLPQIGVSVQQENDFLPVAIQGSLQPKNITTDGSLSSQFLSGLLMAYAFSAKEEVVISVKNLVSRPYIDLTLNTLKHYGKELVNEGYEQFTIIPSFSNPDPQVKIQVEADWSSTSYWIVAALFSGSLRLEGLTNTSVQADRAILEVIKQCGGNITWENGLLVIHPTDCLSAFDFDATDCPDLFPILSILATQCDGTCTIKGLHRLAHKESNREESITKMLTQFGVEYQIEENTLIVKGNTTLQATDINSFNDHRIAMAASIAALKAEGVVIIERAECVAKSYPDFFNHLQQLGASITVSP